MRSLMFAVCAAAVLMLPVRAAAQNPAHVAADSPKVTITVSNPTLVGTTTLKPGDYRFQCKHLDGKSFLVISEVGSGKELARVPCEQETLTQKSEFSELRSVVKTDGTRALQSVRIKGETIAHRIVG